ncbi:MAG: rhodanese-like domain-containing protein [Clostridiales bacterium]|jgi:phage shock protein E|nr:rhodanese-like domain-containing protein [Clostridiales bacterium]
MKGLLISAALCLMLAGCGGEKQMETNSYTKITAAEAKAMMDEQKDCVILDVRTQAEYDEGHIEEAVLIPDTEINDRAESELPDKETVILLYCRSGRRSKLAAQALADMGYTNVYEFGGIIDWPYEVVQ